MQRIAHYGLDRFVNKIAYLPHSEVINEQISSALLLLCLNNTPNAKGILTGKFFEYMAAKRPILAIGPEDGDTAHILSETQSGKIFDFDKEEGIQSYLSEAFQLFQNHQLHISSTAINNYSRKELTKKLAQLLDA